MFEPGALRKGVLAWAHGQRRRSPREAFETPVLGLSKAGVCSEISRAPGRAFEAYSGVYGVRLHCRGQSPEGQVQNCSIKPKKEKPVKTSIWSSLVPQAHAFKRPVFPEGIDDNTISREFPETWKESSLSD